MLDDFNAIIGLTVAAWGATVTPHCCDCFRTKGFSITIVSQGLCWNNYDNNVTIPTHDFDQEN